MISFGYEFEEEFNAVTQFVEEKYGIIINLTVESLYH